VAFRLPQPGVMDKTALAVTLLIAFIAAILVLLRLYFSAQMDHWFN